MSLKHVLGTFFFFCFQFFDCFIDYIIAVRSKEYSSDNASDSVYESEEEEEEEEAGKRVEKHAESPKADSPGKEELVVRVLCICLLSINYSCKQ